MDRFGLGGGEPNGIETDQSRGARGPDVSVFIIHPLCIGHYYFSEVTSHGIQYGPGLGVSPFIQDLAQVSEPINTRNEHSETFALEDLLAYPSGAKYPDMLYTHRLESVADLCGLSA